MFCHFLFDRGLLSPYVQLIIHTLKDTYTFFVDMIRNRYMAILVNCNFTGWHNVPPPRLKIRPITLLTYSLRIMKYSILCKCCFSLPGYNLFHLIGEGGGRRGISPILSRLPFFYCLFHFWNCKKVLEFMKLAYTCKVYVQMYIIHIYM